MAQGLFQFDIDDDSPEIIYGPSVSSESGDNITTGWQLLYTGSGPATSPGQLGVGTSYHYTSLDGACLRIGWNGTGIDLLGSARNASYNVSLDGTTSTYGPTNSVLASFDGLENTNHSLLLTTIITNSSSPDAFLTFDKARITYAPPAGIPNNTTAITQILADSNITFKGQWSYETDPTGNSFHLSESAGDRADTTFVGSAVMIYGLTSSYSGIFTVTLDQISTNLSALSSYNDSNTLLFYATDLPQGTLHHIAVTNQENRTLALNVGGISVTSFGNQTTPTGSSSSNSIPAGTIAAVVLAAVLFLVIIGIFYYCCFVRRKARSIDRITFARVEPYRSHEKGDGAAHASPHSGEDLECASLSTSKGYGFGLGLRRGFSFTYRKGKMGSNSSGKSRIGTSRHAESYAMTTQYRDEKRLSVNTLTDDLPTLTRAPESEKLAPGWHNPVARTSRTFKCGLPSKNIHGLVLPEIYVEHMDPSNNDDDDADVKTLTSRQDETLAATLLLSPRTSEAQANFNEVILSKDSIDVQRIVGQLYGSELLGVRGTSSLRVDMAPVLGARRSHRDSRRTSGSGESTWSKVRARLYRRAHRDDGRQSYQTDRRETSSSSGPESVPVVMHESGSVDAPTETAPGLGTHSFLDLTSSHISLGRHSKSGTLGSAPAEIGHGARERSTCCESTLDRMQGPTVRVRDDPKPDAPSTASGGSSDNSGTQTAPSATTAHTQRSSPFPFPVTIPLPTHTADLLPERHITPSPHTPQQTLQVPRITPSELALIPADSPTESVPFSASEIRFRHSFSDYAGLDSRRASVASVLPPHPPLPHYRGGSQSGSPAYSPPPPYIVQRVLGLPISPLSPVSAIVGGHRRPGTAPGSQPPLTPVRVGSLLGPRPRPSTVGSVRGTAAPQLPMQGGRGNSRGPR